jgi:hypothetical protein
LKFQKFRCAYNASCYRRVVQDAYLREQRRLVPVEMLAGYFAGLEPNDAS